MTPREWTRFVESQVRARDRLEKRELTMAWMTARLTREGFEFPSLASLLEPPVEVVELSDAEATRQAELNSVIMDKLARRGRKADAQ